MKKILYFQCFVCLITLSACSHTSQSKEKTITGKNEKTDAIFDVHKNELAIENSLNILSISLRYGNKNICLIGTRMRVGKKLAATNI